MPRSGSEFVAKLTKKVMGNKFPVNSISFTPGRMIHNYAKPKEVQCLIKNNRGIIFFSDKNDHFFKIESPGVDTLCLDLSSKFTEIKWLASMRKIDKIIISHHNLLKWGWPEQKILNAYKNDLFFYEYIAKKQGLFIINVDEPLRFNCQKFLDFLGINSINSAAKDFIDKWYVVNPLANQKKKAGEKLLAKEIPENINSLRSRHPWINDIENAMEILWKKCL
jgi:hypothetical protein